MAICSGVPVHRRLHLRRWRSTATRARRRSCPRARRPAAAAPPPGRRRPGAGLDGALDAGQAQVGQRLDVAARHLQLGLGQRAQPSQRHAQPQPAGPELRIVLAAAHPHDARRTPCVSTTTSWSGTRSTHSPSTATAAPWRTSRARTVPRRSDDHRVAPGALAAAAPGAPASARSRFRMALMLSRGPPALDLDAGAVDQHAPRAPGGRERQVHLGRSPPPACDPHRRCARRTGSAATARPAPCRCTPPPPAAGPAPPAPAGRPARRPTSGTRPPPRATTRHHHPDTTVDPPEAACAGAAGPGTCERGNIPGEPRQRCGPISVR